MFLSSGPRPRASNAEDPAMGGRHKKNTTGHFSLILVEIQADSMVSTTCSAEKGMLKRSVWNWKCLRSFTIGYGQKLYLVKAETFDNQRTEVGDTSTRKAAIILVTRTRTEKKITYAHRKSNANQR